MKEILTLDDLAAASKDIASHGSIINTIKLIEATNAVRAV